MATAWTAEPIGLPTRRQILLAGLVGGQLAPKLAQVRGKGDAPRPHATSGSLLNKHKMINATLATDELAP